MKRLLYLAIALLAVGCASPLTAAVVTVNTSHDAIVKTHDTLADIDTSDQSRSSRRPDASSGSSGAREPSADPSSKENLK